MGVILYKNGLYLDWSTVCDSPATYGLTEEELRERIEFLQGQHGLRDLPARMERARKHGTSSMMGYESFEDFVHVNRAGYRELRLTPEQIVQIYIVEKRDPTREDGGQVIDDETEEYRPVRPGDSQYD